MSRTYNDLILRNENHSYPEYPNGTFRGDLTLDDKGLVFRPDKRKLRPLVIHLDNLISTYSNIGDFHSPTVDNLYFLSGGFLVELLSLGQVHPWYAYVSIKFKEVEYDKLCVVKIGSGQVIKAIGERWAANLDGEIWDYKRGIRRERWA